MVRRSGLIGVFGGSRSRPAGPSSRRLACGGRAERRPLPAPRCSTRRMAA